MQREVRIVLNGSSAADKLQNCEIATTWNQSCYRNAMNSSQYMYATTKYYASNLTKFNNPKKNAQTNPSNLLVRHARLQVVILAIRVLEAVLALLHMLALVPTQSLDRDVDQAVAAVPWVVAGALPPHGTTKTRVLDVVDLLTRDLRRVVGDHGAGCWVVGPGCYGLRVVEDLSAGLGESL